MRSLFNYDKKINEQSKIAQNTKIQLLIEKKQILQRLKVIDKHLSNLDLVDESVNITSEDDYHKYWEKKYGLKNE